MDTRSAASFFHRPSLALVIDQGTHATRAMLVDEVGKIRFSHEIEVGIDRQGGMRVEQSSEKILESVDICLSKAVAHAGKFGPVNCAGLATQRSSVVAWDRETGRALTPVISWQDHRTVRWVKQFEKHAGTVHEKSGLPLSPHYGGSKLRWLMGNVPAVRHAYRSGTLAWGPLMSFLLFNLLEDAPYVVDHANAQRTQLWNIQGRTWDPWLLDLFEIPPNTLPQCVPIRHTYGFLKGCRIPLTAANGDQTASLYSLGRPSPREAFINAGTGAFVMHIAPRASGRHFPLLLGLAGNAGGKEQYIVEGTVNGAGAALAWAAEQWNAPGLINRLSGWLNREGPFPVFINTIGGVGSPWWRSDLKPFFSGSGALWQKAVAVAESIVFLLQANLDAMARQGFVPQRIQMSGGLSRIDGMCQRMADLSGKPVYRPAETQATVRGAAWLAFGCPRRWLKPGRGRVFVPRDDRGLAARYHTFCHTLDDMAAKDSGG